jgi:hypothetical protein
MLGVWLSSLRWQVRFDLTFRAGTDGCSAASVGPARAQRRLEAFMVRLAGRYQRPLTYFAASELQNRGVTHWHALVRFHGEGVPVLEHSDVSDVWQYWKTWTDIPWSEGVEGYLWQVFITSARQVRYAAKYAAKYGGEWLFGTVRPDGLFGTVPVLGLLGPEVVNRGRR